MSDQRAERQLLAGFYNLEQAQWRWTTHQFAVVLQPPPGTEQTGAKLRVKLFIPEAQIKAIGPMTLTAEIGDFLLTPEKFNKGGAYEYSRNVASELLGSHLLAVVFSFNKALLPPLTDGRELGAVITEILLERKG